MASEFTINTLQPIFFALALVHLVTVLGKVGNWYQHRDSAVGRRHPQSSTSLYLNKALTSSSNIRAIEKNGFDGRAPNVSHQPISSRDLVHCSLDLFEKAHFRVKRHPKVLKYWF